MVNMAEIGAVIDNKYEILTQIGQGGMSVVYLALDRRLNKQWAVKELKKQVNDANNEIVVQSLLTEANLMKKLDHPALPRIVDIIDDKETLYVVMDYIEGTSLDKVVKEYGAQSQENVIEWARQLCEALDYLHTRKPPIIYRDMKPANIMLKPEGGIKIIDFGIAREYKEQNIADTTSLGTRGFAAPEQFGGRGQTDARTDIYSLGVTLYNLVTGKSPAEPPYKIVPIREINPSLSGGLEQIIYRCTMENPDDRYQNCKELLYDILHYEEIDEKYIRRQKRKLIRFMSVAGLSLLLLGTAFGFHKAADYNKAANYEFILESADKEADYNKKIELYKEAIELDGDNTQAYQGLINTCKSDDGVFSLEEENTIIGLVKSNLEGIKDNKEEYIQLSYDIGKLYWFYYDYGETQDNQITRVKSAVPWFNDVINYCDSYNIEFSNYNIAKIFRDIGVFNREYSINIQEASGKGTYIEYFNRIVELNEFVIDNPDEDEIVIWEAYKVMTYSLENYMQKFKSDGVSREEIEGLIESIREHVKVLEATDDITEGIKDYIAIRITEGGVIEEKVTSAYLRKEE